MSLAYDVSKIDDDVCICGCFLREYFEKASGHVFVIIYISDRHRVIYRDARAHALR